MNARVALVRVDRAAGRHTEHPRHRFPPLDLKTIQASIGQHSGVQPSLFDGWLSPFSVEDMAGRVKAAQARIVVIQAVTWCIEESIALGQQLRAAGLITLAMGQQVQHAALAAPSGWTEAFDLHVGGEAEALVPALVAALQSGVAPHFLQVDVPTLPLVRDPDALPAPRFSDDELQAYPFPFPLRGAPLSRWGYLLTARGCPRPCRHCSAIVRKSVGQAFRPRELNRVLDDIAQLVDAGADALLFEDDTIFVHRARLLALCNGMVQRSLVLPWIGNARPDEIDAETASAAAASGARLIKVGIDSGAPALIERINKSARAADWLNACRNAFATLDAQGIGTVALFVIGLPGETHDDAQASLDLARSIPADYVQVQRFQPYPDAAMWPELRDRNGNALQTNNAYHYDNLSTVNCSAMSDAALAAWPAHFYRQFYLRPSYVARHLKHCWQHYLPRPSRRHGWDASLNALRFVLLRR